LSRYAEDALGRAQAQSLGGHGAQDLLLPLGGGWTGLGREYLARPARFAEVRLRAASVVAVFNEGRAATCRATRRG
jgi:hypothetical protein